MFIELSLSTVKMADLEAVLADVSYLMAMEKSKSTPAARASKKIILPDPRYVPNTVTSQAVPSIEKHLIAACIFHIFSVFIVWLFTNKTIWLFYIMTDIATGQNLKECPYKACCMCKPGVLIRANQNHPIGGNIFKELKDNLSDIYKH